MYVDQILHFLLSASQTNLGPVLIAVNSFDQARTKAGFMHNQHLQAIIQTVTWKLATSSSPQVVVLRYVSLL